MKANFNIAKNVRNSRSISALSALRKLQSLGLLLCALLIGSLQVWGAVGDLVTSVTPTSDLASGTTYQAETGTDWAVNVTNNSAFGTNAKSGNDVKLMLSNNSETDSRNTAIASALASYTGSTFTDETQYVAALIGLSSISNVAKVGVTYTGTNGGNPGDMWVLYTTNSGTSYTVAGHTSTVSSGTNITFSTVASAQYAVVFKRTAAFGLKGATISFYEGAAAGFTVTINKNNDSYGNVSAASVTGVTSGTSISASGNVLSVGATNVTATPNSGYKFNNWTGIPAGGTVTGNVTVTANFAAVSYSNYRTLCSTTDPSLSVSPASLNELDYIVGSGPSAAKSFSMSGSNLESGTLTVTAPTNFQVSKASGSGWASSITFTDVSGTLAATTVYVRLATGKSVGEYSGNVSISGCGLESAVNVALSGTVFKPTIIATPASVSWSTAVGVAPTTQSVTITGTHLKGAISATLNGTDAGSFSISTSSIAKATAEGAGGTITITYTGSYAATTTKTANIQLTASDATTVNVPITFNVIVDPNRYVLTPFGEIGPKDKVIIVGDNGTKYAMSNNNGTTNPPSAIDVTDYIIEAGAALSIADASTMLWNIVKAGDGSFKIKKQSDNTVWLYCTSSNNGVRVGTSAENDFVIVNDGDADGYIRNTYRDALIGVYQSTDWRRYEYGAGHSIGTNIAGQTFSFYVQKSTDPFVTLISSFSEFTYEHNHGPSVSQSFTVSGTNLQGNITITPPSNYAISTDNSSFSTSPINLSPTDGTVASTTLYIQLVAGLAVGTYNVEQASGLSVTSTNADAVKVAVNGSVTPESFTVTATSSNVSHGTVSPASQSTTTNMTITASPVDGYRVVSGAGGYTVTAGTASVTNNGDNTFTVTPSTDCTVRINFEAIPTHKVTYWATGTKIQETDVREGAAIPDQTTETAVEIEAYCSNREHFVGWTANSTYSDATDAPADLITTMSPGGTMSTSDVNYYAVFANTGGTSTTFSRVTSLSQLADGDVIVIVSGSSNQYILEQTSTGITAGGIQTATTSITNSNSAQQWTLEASGSDWKLCKDASNKLTTTPGYSAYGNTLTIENSYSENYFFIRSSGGTSYLEYYSGWKFWSTNNPSGNNGNIRNAIYKQDAGYVDYTTQCCSLQPVTDVVVNSMTNTSVTLGWTLPASTAGITKFQVIDVDNGNAVVKDNISTSATNSGSISGLTKCNTYHYKVVSYSSTCTVTSSAIEFRPFGDARTVNFNYNGGSGTPASFTTSCNGTSTTLPTPDARDGYTFLGWWSASSGGVKKGDAGDNYDVTGNTTIWAHWAQNFTVTYNRRGGTIVCGGSEIGVAGQTFTICTTEPTRSGYIFAGWDTEEGGTGTRYNAGGTFTMPSSDVTLYAQWTANWRNLTFNVPEGGGSATSVPSGSHVLDGQSFTMPTITGKSDSKWCWTFLGWTETAPNGSGTWATTPSYIAGGATSGAITSDKTYYAVYTKTGAGASGTVELTSSIIDDLFQAKLDVAEANAGAIAYGTERSATSGGYTWTTTARQLWNRSDDKHCTYLQFNTDNTTWLKLPTFAGPISSITIDCRNASGNALASGSVYLRTTASGSNEATGTISSNTCTFGETELTTGYLVAAQNMRVLSLSVSYGPPTVYGYTLDDCGCQVTQFDLTYNANTDNFPSSTISCANVDDYVFAAHGDEYTFCDAPTLAGYRFLYWAENANGSGNHWNAGETVTCLPSDNLTVYAYYEAVHTVTFDNQGVQTPVTQASAGASIDVPSATTPCNDPADPDTYTWTFVGWSETAITPGTLVQPAIEITAGTSTYTPTTDKTLYAIYKKTTTASDAFVAGGSGAYKIKATSGLTDYYAAAFNSAKLNQTTTPGDAVTYYITYNSAGSNYTIQRADGQYIAYKGKPASSGTHTDLQLSNDPFYWLISSAGGGLWSIQSPTSTDANTRYLQLSVGTGFKAYTSDINPAFVPAASEYYYRTMSCADEFDIIFHDNGTTINWAGGHPEASYQNLADGTTVSTFPTATYDGWTFLGWRAADYDESTTAPTASGIYSTGGNSLTIASSNVDLYPVFTRFEDNPEFDQINGGNYYIYYLASGTDDGYGDEKRVYAGAYADGKRYGYSVTCDGATEFTFTKLANGKWTIYDNTTHKYLCDKNDDWLCQQNDPAEWTITVYSGNQFDAYSTHSDYHIIAWDNGDGASSARFQNYSAVSLTTSPTLYHRVYLGGCTNRTFTTNPSTTPYITMNGDIDPITSSQNGAVRAASVLSVSGGNLTPSTGTITISSNNSDIYFSLTTDKNFAKATENQPKSEVTITANGSGIVTPTPVYVHYKPSSNTDTWTDVTVTASYPGAVSQTASIDLRTVKENFVIASKVGDSWYALPANMSAEGVFEPVLIEVDESNKVAYGPSTVAYKMWPVQTVNGGTDEYATNGDKVRFAGNSNAGLWASNSNNYIRDWATITAIGSTAETPAAYEWIIQTEDRNAYTLKSMYSTHYLDLYRPSSGGNAGKLVWASNSTYVTNDVHFFPLTERTIISIIPREWKSNGLVFAIDADNNISLTSGHTTAKIGTGEAASATLTRHSTGGYGLYEVALPDLTSHYGKVLTLKMKIGGVDTYAYATIPIIVTGTTTTTTAETPFSALGTASKDYDVVILDGAKLTTNATASGAHEFQNFYVYSGGTWVNDNGSTSLSYLELRGGIKGIGAKDSHVQGVPHVLLNKAVSSTAGANLDMTVYTDHGYALSVPFDVDLSKVNFANSLKPGTGAQVNGTLASQFWIRKYDGAVRAANGKGGWVDLEPEEVDEVMVYPTIYAGEGYTLQGKRPKGQPFAVIRFPFSGVGSWADSNGEVAKANIPIYAHDGSATTPDNDKGWNLIANPYMATIAYNTDDELTWAASFKVGSLEKTDGDTWDGKYQWKNASNAYVTIPNDSYTAYPQTRASKATFYPFKNFFIQASSNGVVAFVRADRSEIQQRLMAQEEQMAPIFADINLAHGGESAQAGLTIDADATTGYKFGEDYTIFESREALDYLKVYTIADGHYLVGNTLTPEETAELIPLEFYAPNTEGAYVFSLDDDSDIDRLEYMILYDAELGLSTNLLTDNYTVNLGKTGLIENRFSIGLKIRENQNTPTGTDNVNGETDRPFKFIYQDKMYILRGGVIYDATGKRVMEINK